MLNPSFADGETRANNAKLRSFPGKTVQTPQALPVQHKARLERHVLNSSLSFRCQFFACLTPLDLPYASGEMSLVS